MQNTPTYREQSRIFLEQAYVELEAGDLRQASEKGWGAAALILKAVSEERQWQHGTHRLLFTNVRRLASEARNGAVQDGFHAASSLHTNFYEGRMEAASVSEYLGLVRVFVDVVEELLEGR